MSLFSKLLITLGILVYIALIPMLEWNDSHVFNSAWPPHARFHELWQLFSNFSLGIVALGYCWIRNDVFTAAVISCCVMAGVIFAESLADFVGASAQSGNIAKQLMGIDLAVVVAGLVIVFSIVASQLHRRQSKQRGA
jgi:hypothetical protein